MSPYENLALKVLEEGVYKADRTGVGTISTFGQRLEFDLADGFPLVTAKRVFWKGVVLELLWFLAGETNSRTLEDSGVNIWRPWADQDGELGNIYSYQWRSWPTPDGGHIDQLSNVLDEIKVNPDSRRLLVSAWNVADLDAMALAPCHVMFQFYVVNGYLDLQVYQRSADVFLGLPFNIASYALLTHMVAQQTGLLPNRLIWVGGDVHIYRNHLDQVLEQVKREPYPLPQLELAPAPSLFDYTPEHVRLLNYRHHPAIKAEVAV